MRFIDSVLAGIKAQPKWFWLTTIVFLIVYGFVLDVASFFGVMGLGIMRAPMNPVVPQDVFFWLVFSVLGGAFIANWKHVKSGPKVCGVAGGIGAVAGLWALSCPFCSLFILTFFGVPAAAGIFSFPDIEPFIDVIRVVSAGLMVWGLHVMTKK